MGTDYYPTRPGWIWHDGKLIVFHGPRKDNGKIEVIEGWRDGKGIRSWEKSPTIPWRGCYPPTWLRVNAEIGLRRSPPPAEADGEQLLFDWNSARQWSGWQRRRAAYQGWVGTLPPTLRDMVGRFNDRQVSLLRLAARCGTAGTDLLASSSGLAYCMANHFYFDLRPSHRWRAINSMLRHRQRECLARLGWRFGSEQESRILKAINPASISITRMLALRTAMREPDTLKALSHVANIGINAGVIALVTDFNRVGIRRMLAHASPALLAEVAARETEVKHSPTADLLADSIAMLQALRRRPGQYSSIRRLEELHELLVEELRHSDMGPSLRLVAFPEPPIMGIELAGIRPIRITPITSAKDLHREGQEMHHCCAGYAYRVADGMGDIYFYKVEAENPEERATLLISKHHGCYYRDEEGCKGPCNHRVSADLLRRIDHWLEEAQQPRVEEDEHKVSPNEPRLLDIQDLGREQGNGEEYRG